MKVATQIKKIKNKIKGINHDVSCETHVNESGFENWEVLDLLAYYNYYLLTSYMSTKVIIYGLLCIFQKIYVN